MATSTYLSRSRHGIFYFRITIPNWVWGSLQRPEIRKSLRTTNHNKAIRIAHLMAAKAETLFQNARLLNMDINAVRAVLDRYLNEQLDSREQIRLSRGTKGPDELKEQAYLYDTDLNYYQTHLAENRYKEVYNEVKPFLKKLNINPDPSSVEYKQVAREVLKMYINLYTIDGHRNLGDYSHLPPPTPPSQPDNPQSEGESSQKVANKLSETINKYVLENSHWTSKTRKENQAIYDQFIEILGDIQLSELGFPILEQYKEALIKLPANRKKDKRYRDKQISDILIMDSVKPASISTINKQIIRVSTFLKWCVQKNLIDKNYAEKLTIPRHKRADEEREAFDLRDIEIIFTSDQYQTQSFKHSYQYWLPLLGLYTGARIEEICQLHLDDIYKTENIWVIDINSKEDKKLKTKAGKRIIPVHPTLIEKGLLERIDELEGLNKIRLFPELIQQRDGYSQAASKWFGRYKKSIGITDSTKVFHSFRHTFTNTLKQASVPEDLIAELVGHEYGSITMNRYGKRYNPSTLQEAIKKIPNYEFIPSYKNNER